MHLRLTRDVVARGALALCVLSAFSPYPAVDVGRSTGIQISQACALVAFAAMRPQLRVGRHTAFYFLWCGTLVISLLLGALGNGLLDESRAVHAAIAEPLAVAPLLIGGGFALLGLERLVRLVSIGILMNAVIGGIQLYEFMHDRLPFVSLYRNASFASVQDNAEVIALYIHRPFGLFPEPSAMAASLAPWLVVLIGASQRGVGGRLAKVAVVGGLALVVASRSGFSVPLCALAIVVFVREATRGDRMLRITPPVLPALVVPGGGFIVYYIATHIGRALTLSSANASYSTRAATIQDALWQVTSSAEHILAGVGPGQAYVQLQADVAAGITRIAQLNGTVGVDSVLIRFVAEGGLFMAGAVVITGIALVVSSLREVRPVGWGATAGIALLIGLMVVTSYDALSPLWLALALLMNWSVTRQVSDARCA